MHALLGTPGDTTQVTLLASNKEEGDILAGDTLDRWSADHESRFKVRSFIPSLIDSLIRSFIHSLVD